MVGDGCLIRFGLLGCGRIGSRHAEEIHKNPRAILVSNYDIEAPKAKALSEKYSCKQHTSLDDFLNDDLDVVSICTPSGLHAKMSIQAMQSGKHVLCEKPMTTNLADADEVAKVEEQTGKKFMLVKQNRYNPPIKALKEAVLNGYLGNISLVNCNVMWNRRMEYYTEASWRGTMALDGGALMTQCSHFLDLMLWIGGSARSVYASLANLAHSYIETEDAGLLTIKFKNGAIGSLQYTTNVYQKNFEGTMTVLGSTGTIKIGGEYLNEMEYWNVEGRSAPVLEIGRSANDYGGYKGSMSNHHHVIENAVRVILGEESISANSQQGRESVEVMQAAYISSMLKSEVCLPLKGNSYTFKLEAQPPISGNYKAIDYPVST